VKLGCSLERRSNQAISSAPTKSSRPSARGRGRSLRSPVPQDLASDVGSGAGNIEVSPSGIVVAVTGYSRAMDTQPILLDSNGRRKLCTRPPDRIKYPSDIPHG